MGAAYERRNSRLTNPSDGSELAYIALGAAADIDQAVAAVQAAQAGDWGALTPVERGRILVRMPRIVTERADALARLEGLVVGKPLKQARADALALACYLDFYAGAADKLRGETIPYQRGYTVLILREALGVTGHIILRNYPMQIIGRGVVGAVAPAMRRC